MFYVLECIFGDHVLPACVYYNTNYGNIHGEKYVGGGPGQASITGQTMMNVMVNEILRSTSSHACACVDAARVVVTGFSLGGISAVNARNARNKPK